jgi:hypothetical protein
MIWVRNTQVRSDIRYFFPMVLVSFPWIALGFLKLSDWGVRLLSWGRDAPPLLRPATVIVLAVVIASFGMFDTNLASARFMREHAELGNWIHDHFGPHRTIVGNLLETRLVQYYSQGRIVGYFDPRDCGGGRLPQAVRDCRPDVLVLWTDSNGDSWTRYAETVAAESGLGYRLVARDQLPAGHDGVLVLVRVPPAP